MTSGWRGCRIRRPSFVAWAMAGTGSARSEGAEMPEYLIYFNQQWVGDHDEEWFRSDA